MNYLVYSLLLVLFWTSVQAAEDAEDAETGHLYAGHGTCYLLDTDQYNHIELYVLDNYDAEIYFMYGTEELSKHQVQTYDETYYVPEYSEWYFCVHNYYGFYSIRYEISITSSYYLETRNAPDYLDNKKKANITSVHLPQVPTVQIPSSIVEMEVLPNKSKKSKDLGKPEYV